VVLLKFTFPSISEVHYGENSTHNLGDILRKVNAKRVLVISNHSVHGLRFYGAVLSEIDIPYEEFYEITQHTPMEELEHATEMYRNKKCDSIITVGGGSVIDAGKAMRYFYDMNIPQIAIPTTLSAAEFSPSAGYTIASEKNNVRDPRLVPAAVILDPLAVMETPQRLWRSTGMRAIDHAVETAILNHRNQLAVDFSLKALSMLLLNLDGDTKETRHQCQIGAWYSYFDISDSALGLSHHIGRIIGARYEIPHGITTCITLPEVLLYYGRKKYPGLSRVSSHLGFVTEDPEEASVYLSNLIRYKIHSLGLSSRLSDYGISESDLEYILSKLDGERSEMRKLLLSMV